MSRGALREKLTEEPGSADSCASLALKTPLSERMSSPEAVLALAWKTEPGVLSLWKERAAPLSELTTAPYWSTAATKKEDTLLPLRTVEK